MDHETRLRIGVLTRPFGLAGGIRCELDAEAVPLVTTPTSAWIGYTEAFLQQVSLVRCDSRPSDLICYFDGVNKQEETPVFIERGLWLPSESIGYKSSFAHPQLAGYAVTGPNAEALGTIVGIFRTRAHVIWNIVRSDGQEWMLPAIDEFVVDVDHDAKHVSVRTIPGMVEDVIKESGDDVGT